MDVVASIQGAIEIVGKLRALSKTVENADFKMLLADLSGELADAKLSVAELKIQLAAALDVNRNLTEQIERRTVETPIITDGVYTFAGREGHFCTACYDSKNQLALLALLPDKFRVFGKWRCPVCDSKYAGAA